MRSQVLAHLALNLIGMGNNLVEAAILGNKRACFLRTNARNAWNIVRSVSFESIEVRYQVRRNAVIQIIHTFGGHDGHIRKTLARRNNIYVLSHQLIHVAIACNQVHVATGRLTRTRHGA